MAGEIQIDYITGQTVYALLLNSSGQFYNTAGAAFESFSAGNYTDYDIALTEQGSTGIYIGDMPGVALGYYSLVSKLRAGGSPAQTDISIADGEMQWSGSIVATLNSYADALLKRDWTAVTGEASRSVLNALRKLRNKWAIVATTLSIYKEDDSTVAYTQNVTGTPGADPITDISN